LDKQQKQREDRMEDLEAKMQQISLIISVIAIGLMVYGFADAMFQGNSFSLPGFSALPMAAFSQFTHPTLGLWLMSAGIVMLSALPGIRILLALVLFIRSRHLLDTLVTLVVLLELLFSIHFSL
jgi:uncharacterized membrane protein